MRCFVVLAAGTLALSACSNHPDAPAHPVAPTLEMIVPSDSIQWDARPQATLVYRDSTGNVAPIRQTPVWASSDSSTIWVSGAGQYTTAGDLSKFSHADLVARVYGLTARHTIYVSPRIGTLILGPAASARAVGTTDTLHVTARGGPFNAAVPMPDSILQWRSSNPDVLGVNAHGVIAARAVGDAWIKVSYSKAADSLLVRVVAGYRATEIPAWGSPYILRMNARGDVLGYPSQVYVAGTGQTQTIGGCGVPVDINDAGEVLCNRDDSTLAVWKDGAMRVLAAFPERPTVLLSAHCFWARFNSSGAIAYVAMDMPTSISCDGTRRRTGIWKPDGSVTPLSTPAGPPSAIYLFDDVGNVAVAAGNGAFFRAAGSNAWDGFGQTIADPSYYPSYYAVSSVNSHGYMVGSWSVRWAAPSGMRRAPYGDPTAVGPGAIFGVNNASQIIGHWNELNAGFLGSLDNYFSAPLADLTTDTRWVFGDPLGLNDLGMIVARATRRSDGQTVLVLMTPIS